MLFIRKKKMYTTHTRDILFVPSKGGWSKMKCGENVEKTICSHLINRIQDQIMETTLKN